MAMKQAGYTPPPPKHRRGPQPKTHSPIRTGNVAVLTFGPISVMMDIYDYSINMKNISCALAQHGLRMIYAHITNGTTLPSYIVKDADAFIVIHGEPSDKIAAKLEQKPLVYLCSRHTDSGDQILHGHFEVGKIAAKYLIDRGLSALVFINALPEIVATHGHCEGFRSYAASKDVENYFEFISPLLDKPGSVPIMNLLQLKELMTPLIDRLLALKNRPVGVFISNGNMTAIAYSLLLKNNITPGKDFVFVSVNNIEPVLAGLYPRPASIDIGVANMGEHAVNLLLWRIQSGSSGRPIQITIRPTLVDIERISAKNPDSPAMS